MLYVLHTLPILFLDLKHSGNTIFILKSLRAQWMLS